MTRPEGIVEPDEEITPVDARAKLTPRKKAAVAVGIVAVLAMGYYGTQVLRDQLPRFTAKALLGEVRPVRPASANIPNYAAKYANAERVAEAAPAQSTPDKGKQAVTVVEDIGKTRAPAQGGSSAAQPAAQPPKDPRFEGRSIIKGGAGGALQRTAADMQAAAAPADAATEAAAVTRPARVAHPQRTVAKGTPATCTIPMPLDSTFASMPICILDMPVYSMAGGRRPLLNAGTKLIGKSEPVKVAGQEAGFVEWVGWQDGDLQGVIASPATDQLGRARIPGEVDTHFWQRFGPPALLSIVSGVTANVGRGSAAPGVSVVLPGVAGAGRTAAQSWVDRFSNVPATFRSEAGIRVGLVFDRSVEFPQAEP